MTIDPIPAPTARLITRAEFASLLGMSIRTLENWERQGYGPTPVRFGRAVRYGADDVMTYYSPNGGGYGNPLNRAPRKVLEDVLDGFCSVENAREVYGVAIDLETETVDMATTEKLRFAMQRHD